ncbi:Ribosylpyrimidine nucleosidase [Parasphaerochaeta coccoides DSM 17374]|uniref:Ribosylpyrimidine nucleosidase n=2 Tax=Parasphaerochaeta TaxID=3062336 RepID=F4GKD1_PARC1|nr:Ribosylpyrimidine nucleosidase [Parasphaerochaeta coccoides DSM 17374]
MVAGSDGRCNIRTTDKEKTPATDITSTCYTTVMNNMNRIKHRIIMDVDTGHDDAAAIVLAAGSPEIKIEGIVAVGGNQIREKTLANTLNVCQHIGLDVPVFAGQENPLVRKRVNAGYIHGESGLDGPHFAPRTKLAEKERGVDFIIRTVMENPGEITIVALGPLTDIALALILEPRLKDAVRHIVTMGGSMGMGNATPSAEFNIYADPEAAYVVCSSGVPLTMFTLDVTLQVTLDDDMLSHYRKMKTKTSTMFCDSMNAYTEACQRHGFDYPAMHDPCCIAYLVEPEIFTMEKRKIDIELKGELTYGRTVMGFVDPTAGSQVGVTADAPAFWRLLDRAFTRLP